MKDMIRRIFTFVLFLYMAINLYCQSLPWSSLYTIDYIDSRNGLPNDYIDYIFKDSRGFIWFATNGTGVVRYDSYQFKSINLQTSPDAFRNNYAQKICEDPFRRLWVIGQDGIDLIDIQSLNCVNMEKNGPAFTRLKNTMANDIICSQNGHIWISTNNRLLKVVFSEKDGSIDHIQEVFQYAFPCTHVSLCEHHGFIYFNQNDGIYKIPEDKDSRPVRVLKQITDANIIKSYQEELWIGTNHGLFIFNEKKKRLKEIDHNPDNPHSLSQSQITDIAFKDSETALISTLKGLNLYHLQSGDIERIQEIKEESDKDLQGLNCNFINCLFYDRGVIWVGTEAGGINKMTRKRLQVRNLLYHKSSFGNVINCIEEDHLQRLWVGAVEGGLYLFENTHSSPVHYTQSAPAFLSHLSVSCLTFESDYKLWIGTWGGGLGWINTDQASHPLFHAVRCPSDEYNIRHIRGISFDHYNGLLWIAADNDIYAYDPSGQRITTPLHHKNLGGIKAENAGCLIDRNHFLWLGLSKGLCRINLKTYGQDPITYKLWPFKLDNPSSGIKEHISYIFEGQDGTIWIGSNGFGIYQVVSQGQDSLVFKRFDSSDGLINNCVRGISEDQFHNLWITTTQGISCFNPQTHTFSNYTTEDGLLSNQFYWNSICRGQKGEIFAGSMSGLSVISPSPMASVLSDFPIVITDLRIANRHVSAFDKKVRMHENDKTLTIEIAALNYASPQQTFYAYRIKELNEKWQEINPDNRRITFTNLKAGTYTFEAIYSVDHKNWNTSPLSMTFQVIPPFYKRGWFVGCMILLLVAILSASHFQRIRRLKLQRDRLDDEVKSRTRELTCRNSQLSEQNALIVKQKEEIIEASKRIQELTSDQLSFFTNIAHEFRTPLTLIIGPTERALQMSDNKEVNQQLQYVSRNSQYLLQLVNQLLDFRKMEAGKIEPCYSPCHIQSLLNQVTYPLTAYASDRKLTLNIYSHFRSDYILTDEKALQKIIINLVSNALKFTPAGGHIKIYTALLTHSRSSQKYLFISVCDNGIGIKPEHLKYIFDMFYQSKPHDNQQYHASGGTGIGLYFCKQLTKLLNGQITVKNNPQKGCTFRVILPAEISEEKSEPAISTVSVPTNKEIQPTAVSSTQKQDILIVEDNTDMRAYIRSILQSEFNIHEASNGKEALTLLKEKHTDLVISDLMMPVMDGLTLSREVKSDLSISHIPFIILTANTTEESRIDSYEIGVDDYLTKPFNEKTLLARIKNILTNRKQAQLQFADHMDTRILQINESSKDNAFIEDVMSFIKTHYTDPDFEINDLVKHMGISRSLFYQKLQDLTGESAGHIIRDFRLNTARELIVRHHQNKDSNISEIAYKVGFSDPKYFSRCFTKRFNISPSALMKQSEQT